MGGLVTRRYAQIFGESEIDRIILITVPNHGIDGQIEGYCSLIGSLAECKDMAKNSILLNKLDNVQNMTIPVYNLVGMGCKMNGDTGDGIVTETSQYLSYANNSYIEGFCDELSLDLLHEKILNPEKYPRTYEFINQSLGA